MSWKSNQFSNSSTVLGPLLIHLLRFTIRICQMGKLFITASLHNKSVVLATQRLIPLFFQARYASEYILEIGLYTFEVYAYSARIRCAAVLYLIRALLQNFCNAEGTNILRSITFTQRNIPLWTQTMARVMNTSVER